MTTAGGIICRDRSYPRWEGQVRVPLEQPWSRVREPVAIPTPVEPRTLHQLDQQDLARVLRDHLVPRQPHGVERTRWESLWQLLSSDDELADRAFDVLEHFLEDVEQALAAEDVDEHSRKRMEKFKRFCDDAWQRLRLHHDRPLGWAGRAGAGFNPAGRLVIGRLVEAIAEHRRRTVGEQGMRPADVQLWRVLGDVGLDPDGPGRTLKPDA